MSILAFFLAAACGGSSMVGPEGTEGSGSPSVSAVRMTPSDVAVHVDGAADLSVEVVNEDGEPLDREAQWKVRDGKVAEVQGDGDRRQVVGRSEGTTWVVGAVDGVADSANVEVTPSSGSSGGSGSDPDTSVASVQLSPSDVTVEEGSRVDVSVTVTAEDGSTLDRSGTWVVGDPAVARVDGSGSPRQVEGLVAGASTSLVATVDGVADTASVEVVAATSSPADAEPAVVFDPDRYSSTQELMDDPYGVFGGAELGEDGEKGQITLDTQVAPPGGSKSMRYDFIDQGVGNSLRVGRRMPLPSRAKEVWMELQVRWSTNFFAIRDFPQDGSTFAHKFLFGEAKASATSPNWETSEGWNVNRWSLLFPGGGSPNPPDGPITVQTPRHENGESIVENTDSGVSPYFDGRWHTIRLHWRHDPGRYYVEIDGEVIADVDGFTIHPEVDLTAILLGRNKDDGIESGTESLWWGKMSVWTEDPGW